jgi:predicted Zn finger-like uncharacterized protein
MILTCPQCTTRYQADAAKFPAAGRSVRCAKCGHVWHQDAPAPQPEPDIEPEIEVAEVPRPEPVAAPVFRPQAYAPRPVIAADEPEIVENTPVHSRWLGRLAVGLGWAGLVGLILLIGWAAVTYRQQVATLWPQSSSLYAALGMKANATGIDFADVTYKRESEDGQWVLAVAGNLVNKTSRELPVPQIRVTLIDDDQRELYHWTFVPGVMTLHPGQVAKFLTRLSNPPAAAHRFEVRFARAGE